MSVDWESIVRPTMIGAALAVAAFAAPAAAQGVRALPGSRVETQGKGATTVEAGDLDLDGVLDLVAIDGDPQKGLRVLLGRGDGTFEPGVPYVGPHAWKFTVADITGDGFPDLVGGDFNPDPPLGVWVFPSLGDGSFGPPITSSVGGSHTHDMAAGDFDGDGHMDLAVKTVGGSMDLRVGLGNGDGSFGPFLEVDSTSFAGLVAADMNLDGRLDLIDGVGLTVLLGNGDGTFQNPIVNQGGGYRLFIVELDGDGVPDAVTVGLSIRVHLGQGDGTLLLAADYPKVSHEEDARLADMDGDGRLDLVSAQLEGSGVGQPDPGLLVRLGLPGIGFGPPTFYRTGGEPSGLAAGDFDGDGAIDVALGQQSNDSDTGTPDIGLAFGRGDGSFDVPDVVELGARPLATELADMNGDGHLDLVTTVKSSLPAVRIALGHGDGSFDAPVGVDVGDQNTGELAVADLDGDGALDLVVAGDPPFGATVVALGAGDGVTFGAPQQVATSDVTDVRVGHLDDDDAPDIVVSRHESGVLTIYHGDGRGGFGEGQYLSAGGFPNGMALADLTGDGRTDIAAADSDGVVGLLVNVGGGAFAVPQTLPAPGNPLRIVAGDFDRDGLVDLATSHKQPKQVHVFLGTGGGAFATPITSGLGQVSRSMAAADVNRDGLLDLIGVHGVEKALILGPSEEEQPGLVSLLLGRGDGTFLPRRLFFAGEHPLDQGIGDVDEDGLLDVAATAHMSSEVWVLRNLSGPWENLGFALAAPAGSPVLTGSGQPTAGETIGLLVTGVPPGSPGLLFVGLSTLMAPLKGGVLVPAPTIALPFPPLVAVHGPWSPGIPPGTPVYFQAWYSIAPDNDVVATNALLTLGE